MLHCDVPCLVHYIHYCKLIIPIYLKVINRNLVNMCQCATSHNTPLLTSHNAPRATYVCCI